MARQKKTEDKKKTGSAGTWNAAEYKHVVLGLIFLKYISNASPPEWAV